MYQKNLPPHSAGWVEHDPLEIWATQSGVMSEVIGQTGLSERDIKAIGITNQEKQPWYGKSSGRPVYNAIVWQDRRTADYWIA